VSDAKERLMDAITELIWTGSYGSTTIDQICEKAGVKKAASITSSIPRPTWPKPPFESNGTKYRPELDTVFSPTIPPLDRLRRYSDMGYREQVELKEKHGYVLGCPSAA
jgi:TetR/AcrR family transcriptional repressor of nem operon